MDFSIHLVVCFKLSTNVSGKFSALYYLIKVFAYFGLIRLHYKTKKRLYNSRFFI